MRQLFLVRLAILNTFKHRLRALLAIGGIALSSGVMVVLFGIGGGLHNLVTDQVSRSEVKDVVTVNQRNLNLIRFDAEHMSAIKSTSGVGEMIQVIGTVGDGTYHGITLSLPVYGVSTGFFEVAPVSLSAGDTDGKPAGNDVIVSRKVLEAYGMESRSAVGRNISLRLTIQGDYASKLGADNKKLAAQDFTIAGVIDQGTLPVAYVSLDNLTKAGVDTMSQLKLRLTDPAKMPAVRESVEQMGFQTTSLQDSIDEVNRIFGVVQHILLLFGVITLAITVFGTFNIVTITLLQETRQIGFLRVMGLQTSDVGLLFVLQSMLLTGLGALCGVIGGVSVGLIINGMVLSMVGDEALTGLSGPIYLFKLPFVPIIIMLMLSIGLGWLMGMAPAKRAVLINPLEEMRA